MCKIRLNYYEIWNYFNKKSWTHSDSQTEQNNCLWYQKHVFVLQKIDIIINESGDMAF